VNIKGVFDMKTSILLAVLFFSVIGSAGDGLIRFQNESKIPHDLQLTIKTAIQNNCEFIIRKKWAIVETNTATYIDKQNTAHYKTYFSVQAMDVDNMHPFPLRMEVESARSKSGQKKVLTIEADNYCSSLNQ
jgi:hypothetical protein